MKKTKKNKPITIHKEDEVSPYALMLNINQNFIFSKIGQYAYLNFNKVLESCLMEFIEEQCQEYKAHDNSLDMINMGYLLVETPDLNLYKFLLEKIELINQPDIISSTLDSEQLKQEIHNKFNYYLLNTELDNNKEIKKRIKI